MSKLIPDEGKTARINIRIQPSLKSVFQDRCREQGLKPSLVVEKLIEDYVRKEREFSFK